MRTKFPAVLAVFGLVLLSACGSDNPAGITGDASGTYNLTTIDGVLPFTFNQTTTTTDRITGGSFTLNEDGTFTQTLNFDETISGQTTVDASTCQGTYTQNGGNFTFSEDVTADQLCGGTYDGSWNGSSQFTFLLGGSTAIYIK